MPRFIANAVLAAVVAALALAESGRDPEVAFAVFAKAVVVNTTVDEDTPTPNGQCSLREAITTVNNAASYGGCTFSPFQLGDFLIRFNIGENPVLDLATELPAITRKVMVNGNTGGATRVELRGPGGDFPPSGIRVFADESVIANLAVSGGFEVGIQVGLNADGVFVLGNYVGTDASGAAASGNRIGISVSGDSTFIGGDDGWTPSGTCTGDCNLISGNSQVGITTVLGAEGTVVQGNMIGTNAAGTAVLANGSGMVTVGSSQLGGPNRGEGNLIAGNSGCAFVGFSGSSGTIQGNFFGTDTTGMISLTNACGPTINSSPGYLVGGVNGGSGNVLADGSPLTIEDSEDIGIFGNYIGTGSDGVTPLGKNPDEASSSGIFLQGVIDADIGGIATDARNIVTNRNFGITISSISGDTYRNFIEGNSIYGNVEEGIRLLDGSVHPPANLGVQPPVITGLGSLHGTACPGCIINIYSDEEDEGRIIEGILEADGNGDWTYDGPLTGPFVTATATDFTKGTSEFSAPYELNPATPTPSPSTTPVPTPTPTTSLSPSPTPIATLTLIQGDIDCDGDVDEDDMLLLLSEIAFDSFGQPCPAQGASSPGIAGRDVNCDEAVNALDALHILLFVADLPELDKPIDCPPVGAPSPG